MTTTTLTRASTRGAGMTREERFVIFASSFGTFSNGTISASTQRWHRVPRSDETLKIKP
jgi:hypothetical protein